MLNLFDVVSGMWICVFECFLFVSYAVNEALRDNKHLHRKCTCIFHLSAMYKKLKYVYIEHDCVAFVHSHWPWMILIESSCILHEEWFSELHVFFHVLPTHQRVLGVYWKLHYFCQIEYAPQIRLWSILHIKPFAHRTHIRERTHTWIGFQ